MPRIAVDAMGGDRVPCVPVAGAVEALSNHPDLTVVLVGPADQIEAELSKFDYDRSRIEIVHTDEWVEMGESPVEALRNKPNSSLSMMVKLQKEERVDGIFSAGNTGAMVAACTVHLRMLEGVRRPAIALPLPRGKTPVMLCDGGANVECRPLHLLQNAIMAEALLRCAYSVESPKVGLLNVGSERDKGHALAKETYQLLEASGLDFTGNVEGCDIFQADVDVVVCDGFVGNVVLKTAEGFSEVLFKTLVSELGSGMADIGVDLAPFKALLNGGLQKIRSRFDYSEYGGAPLLGPKGVCTIGHGRSDQKAVANALAWTLRMIENGIQQELVDSIEREMEHVGSTTVGQRRTGQAESRTSN
ncbi:MAG: phosphate acyltransferase PlsX [Planctomycetota bacterium]|nr:phosphate acyltransferase PlsX [Planctomycetota bacterium]